MNMDEMSPACVTLLRPADIAKSCFNLGVKNIDTDYITTVSFVGNIVRDIIESVFEMTIKTEEITKPIEKTIAFPKSAKSKKVFTTDPIPVKIIPIGDLTKLTPIKIPLTKQYLSSDSNFISRPRSQHIINAYHPGPVVICVNEYMRPWYTLRCILKNISFCPHHPYCHKNTTQQYFIRYKIGGSFIDYPNEILILTCPEHEKNAISIKDGELIDMIYIKCKIGILDVTRELLPTITRPRSFHFTKTNEYREF